MSRDAYVGGTRSPRGVRLPTVDRSPSRGAYPGGSPLGRKPLRQTRSGNNSPEHGYGYHHSSPYYRDEDLGSPMLEERGRPMTVGPGHHRSRSATRPSNPMSVRYQSLDRGPTMDHEREFLPIRDRRDRSLDRGLYFDDEPYSSSFISRSARQSPTSHQPFIGELQHQNSDLQRDLANLKKELELTNQKLGSSMHSIKTFWSPELKKERALRKEESAKYSLINDQLKLLSSENQKQAMLVRQLEEELRMRMRGPSIEIQQQMEALFQENEHLTREIAILRDTIKELELRIETQKQTLQARDESIKKLLEMLQNKGMGKEEERQMFQQMQAMAQKQLDEFRVEIQRRDQEILAMGAKMKTLEEQHQDYQRHIAVLKESLCAKEEHYNMLQTDVEELRQRLEEKNRYAEKKAQQFQQERARAGAEIAEMREHMEIKDRKINVLQRKMELQEAHKRAAAVSAQKPTEDHTAERRQMAEERKMIEEAKKQFEEQRRTVENKSRQVEEKERALADLDKQLQKQKQQLDQLQNSLQRAGGNAAAVGELNKKLSEAEKKMEQAQEEAKRSATEMERLLQLVQMSQEEQNVKEKQISDLQQALKNAQAKLKQQQQQAQQQEEHENSITSKRDSKLTTDPESSTENKQLEDDSYIKHLESTIQLYEAELQKHGTQRQDQQELSSERDVVSKAIDSKYVKHVEESLKLNENSLRDIKKEKQKLETILKEKDNIIKDLKNNLKNTSDQMHIEIENKESMLSAFEKQIKNIKDRENEKDSDLPLEKERRIQELESALRESIKISTEREMVLIQEEKKRQQIMQKVFKLEQRLLSLQSAQALRCHSCKPYVSRMTTLESKLAQLMGERKKHLQELAHMKREALEAAISEKDAHLALLEITGIRSAQQAEEVERLQMDKRRLLDKFKEEAELSISIDEDLEEDELPISLISNEEFDQT